jgi:hypothetical protein
MKKDTLSEQIHHLFCQFPALQLDDSAGRIAREPWKANQESSPVDIITPWFLMLIYHMGSEQQARSWPQFRDVFSSHRHDHHHQL